MIYNLNHFSHSSINSQTFSFVGSVDDCLLDPRLSEQLCEALMHFLSSTHGINPPIGRPDSDDLPAKSTQHKLT
ncbi:hypothetical protein D3C81_1330230 [compost metagenome]